MYLVRSKDLPDLCSAGDENQCRVDARCIMRQRREEAVGEQRLRNGEGESAGDELENCLRLSTTLNKDLCCKMRIGEHT